MKKKENQPDKDETASKSAVERGKKAIEADDAINKTDVNDPGVKKAKKKDAEQWRNEG